MKYRVVRVVRCPLLAGLLGCSTPLTTREKGAGIGALGAPRPAASSAALLAVAAQEPRSAAYSA